MAFDVFISYSWTHNETKVFVHSLAAHLKTVGFNVGVDLDVDYGDSLSGFMGSICDSKHVLLIIDDSYTDRVDKVPESGVAIENRLLSDVVDKRPEDWLSVVFLNEVLSLPEWLKDRNPKGFFLPLEGLDMYGASQIEDLWRWLVGLPANKVNAISPSVIKDRLVRIERIDNLRDKSMWSCPYTSGTIVHNFPNAPQDTFNVGAGSDLFGIMCTAAGEKSTYLYSDPVHAVGLLPDDIDIKEANAAAVDGYLIAGRTVTLEEGGKFVIQNKEGALLVGVAEEISCPRGPAEKNSSFIKLRYRIMVDE